MTKSIRFQAQKWSNYVCKHSGASILHKRTISGAINYLKKSVYGTGNCLNVPRNSMEPETDIDFLIEGNKFHPQTYSLSLLARGRK